MRKLYFVLSAVLLSTASFSQIGPDWWQMLPEDWRTNVYVRDTIMIAQVADDFVGGYDVLADLWDNVETDIVPVVYKSGGPDADGAADFQSNAKLFWDNANLYVLYQVVDQEVDTALDYVEIHTAPYSCFYEPDRTIYPQGFCPEWVSPKTPDPYDYEFGDRKIPGAEYVAMAKMSSWTEAGAYKMDIKLKTKEEVYPSAVTYTLRGPDKDTLGNVSSGAPEVPMATVFEATADGYYFLVIEPWAVMNDMVPEEGVFEAMSVAIKTNDYDSDNADGDDEDTAPDRADYWGGTTSNDAYWAIAYYGAVGKFFEDAVVDCGLPSLYETLVEAIEVTSEGGVTDVTAADDTLQMIATITPEDADYQYVKWSVSPDSATINPSGELTGFKAGAYTVTVTATSLDGSNVTGTLDINVDIALPSNIDQKTAQQFSVYPSPTRDLITVTNTQKVTRIEIINIVGQPVASFDNAGNSVIKLNVADFRPGIYLMNIRSDKGVTTLKFTKQ
jgi:hypothetical protein